MLRRPCKLHLRARMLFGRPLHFLGHWPSAEDFLFYSISPGSTYSVIFIIIIFCIRTALGMALDTTFQAMGGEVFPTSGRTSAQGLLVLIGGLGGPLGLLTATRLGDFLGAEQATRLMACGQLLTALIVATGFPETHGRELEEINS
ncbi:benK [Symbiodinium natans]|uniref:BenK protein n=1 Tax=Symbiodinium natans TaxID=878477 RepID=A0A812T1A5_9DINO|nr:benK [Symbiodinium natans]